MDVKIPTLLFQQAVALRLPMVLVKSLGSFIQFLTKDFIGSSMTLPLPILLTSFVEIHPVVFV